MYKRRVLVLIIAGVLGLAAISTIDRLHPDRVDFLSEPVVMSRR